MSWGRKEPRKLRRRSDSDEKKDDATISINGSPEVSFDQFEATVNKLAAAGRQRDGYHDLQVHDELSTGLRQTLRLAVQIYDKKAESVSRAMGELGASSLQLDSLRNLCAAGLVAIQTLEDPSEVVCLDRATADQQAAFRSALAYHFAQLEKLMEKETSLMGQVRALARAMSLQLEIEGRDK